ncbi:MAG: hypothetical protein ACK4OM_05580 [Alphaproteobacteria bacterium]
MRETLIKSYISAIEKSDWKSLMELFSTTAKITSPTHKDINPDAYYKEYFYNILFSSVSIKGIYSNDNDSLSLIAHITKNITLINSQNIIYDAVKIFQFSEDYKYINKIEMIYDSNQSQLINRNNSYYDEIKNLVD